MNKMRNVATVVRTFAPIIEEDFHDLLELAAEHAEYRQDAIRTARAVRESYFYWPHGHLADMVRHHVGGLMYGLDVDNWLIDGSLEEAMIDNLFGQSRNVVFQILLKDIESKVSFPQRGESQLCWVVYSLRIAEIILQYASEERSEYGREKDALYLDNKMRIYSSISSQLYHTVEVWEGTIHE